MEELAGPHWYVDRKGETPPGKKEYYQLPIFNNHQAWAHPQLIAIALSHSPICAAMTPSGQPLFSTIIRLRPSAHTTCKMNPHCLT